MTRQASAVIIIIFFFFHKIFRLRLVLTPVSTSGKNSRIPFNGTLPKTTAVGIGFKKIITYIIIYLR
jgi:hypothetical protein